MQVKLTIGERLKDLRVERKLTLEQLSNEVGISKSALGKYESDNGKDISPYSILLLADYYGVSCDYLMGRTETKNHPNTALHELHLSDASIDVLRTGKFNHRLLSELICHKDFQRLMLDADLYGLWKIQLSPQNRPCLASGNIFSIEPLLQLPGNTLCKDGSKQIVDTLKLFRGDALIILLLQHLIGVGEHVVDVLDKDPFVSRH